MHIRGKDALSDLQEALSALVALPQHLRKLESLRQDFEVAVQGLEEVEAHLRAIEKVIPPAVLKLLTRGMSSPTTALRARALKVLQDLRARD